MRHDLPCGPWRIFYKYVKANLGSRLERLEVCGLWKNGHASWSKNHKVIASR